MKPYIKASVPGIGDDAFNGPPGDYPYYITFKKGAWVVSISTFFDPAKYGQSFLTMEQLTGLCQTVAGRL